MSRLVKMAIPLPKGVEIKTTKEGLLHIKGPKGTLEMKLLPGLHLKIDGQSAVIERDALLLADSALQGLYRALVKNCVIGVSEGYEVRLSMIGVGYRANVQGDKLDLQVGFSHPTAVLIPKNIQVTVDKGVLIIIQGIDKRAVGQFSAEVRAVKPPEPYKGKGIRYEHEFVRKKVGKAAKAKAT